jgi:hypothetical protein
MSAAPSRRAVWIRCARSVDFAWLLRIRTLGLKIAHCTKSLIFPPSAAEFPANRLRLLSCHRTVANSCSATTTTRCDIPRTWPSGNSSPALKKRL